MLGCNHIKSHSNYYSATRPPDGDNKQSIIVYKDTLVSNCYTLGIDKTDVIGLVEQLKDLYFTHAIKSICDICGFDYYTGFNIDEGTPKLLKWLDSVESVNQESDEEMIKPIPESILNEYIKLPHKLFLQDNIDIQTQKEFEICYSLKDDRIIIPIRDELGSLIGDKGRTIHQEEVDEGRKYLPNYNYPKSKILYGLYKTLPYIKQENETIICEAEKGILQLWSMGKKTGVAPGGHFLSDTQIEKIIKLNVPVVIAFDKVAKEREKHYIEMQRNIKKIVNDLKLFTKVYLIWDTENILEDRQSPTDNALKWQTLYNKKHLIK